MFGSLKFCGSNESNLLKRRRFILIYTQNDVVLSDLSHLSHKILSYLALLNPQIKSADEVIIIPENQAVAQVTLPAVKVW